MHSMRTLSPGCRPLPVSTFPPMMTNSRRANGVQRNPPLPGGAGANQPNPKSPFGNPGAIAQTPHWIPRKSGQNFPSHRYAPEEPSLCHERIWNLLLWAFGAR